MKNSKKKPSLLTKKDLNNLEQIEWVLSTNNVNEEECVSQVCMRYGYGNMPDEDLLYPCLNALGSLCEDYPEIDENEFTRWYQELIEDINIFKLDKVMVDVIKEVQSLFEKKRVDWIEKGKLDKDYNTDYTFWGIIGMAIYTISYKITDKYAQLNNAAFFKQPLFGRYQIVALEYADEDSLADFQNPRSYNRFDVEAILFYVMDRYDAFDDYKEYRHVLDEIKDIVYEDPKRKLRETKGVIEELARSSKEKQFQYAFFYAGAVIEWYLEKQDNPDDL